MPSVNQIATQSVLRGFGLKLQPAQCQDFINAHPGVDWLEITPEDFLLQADQPWHCLDRIRQEYPLALHGASLRIGGTAPLDTDCLHQLGSMARRLQPEWVSGQLFGSGGDGGLADPDGQPVQPMAYTRQSLRRVCSHIGRAQDFLGRKLVVQSPVGHTPCRQDEMSEAGFLREMVHISGCELPLEVHRVHNSSLRHGFDPHAYVDTLPAASVRLIHLAGHADRPHGDAVADPVWALYAHALERCGAVPALIARGGNTACSLAELLQKVGHARQFAQQVLGALPQARPAAAHAWQLSA